jgi:hypothetical protein
MNLMSKNRMHDRNLTCLLINEIYKGTINYNINLPSFDN